MTPKEYHRFWIDKLSMFSSQQFNDGIFVECGVKQGSASVIMAQNMMREGYLFDTWRGFPHYSKIDAPNERREKKMKRKLKGADTYNACVENLKRNKVYHLCHMIRGDILKTVPNFVKDYPDSEVSMIHVDADLYEPTKTTFINFWPMMKSGSLALVHDYRASRYPGVKVMVDEFCDSHEDAQLFVFPPEELRAAVVVKGGDKEFNKFKEYYEQTRESVGANV